MEIIIIVISISGAVISGILAILSTLRGKKEVLRFVVPILLVIIFTCVPILITCIDSATRDSLSHEVLPWLGFVAGFSAFSIWSQFKEENNSGFQFGLLGFLIMPLLPMLTSLSIISGSWHDTPRILYAISHIYLDLLLAGGAYFVSLVLLLIIDAFIKCQRKQKQIHSD